MLAFYALPVYDVYMENGWKFSGKKKLVDEINRSILFYL